MHGPKANPDTYLTGTDGGVLAAVWRAGRACAWRCSCVCPQPELPGTVQLGLFDLAGVDRG